jgi:hypothetical protein
MRYPTVDIERSFLEEKHAYKPLLSLFLRVKLSFISHSILEIKGSILEPRVSYQ